MTAAMDALNLSEHFYQFDSLNLIPVCIVIRLQ